MLVKTNRYMKMHGETIKIIDAQQAKFNNIYKNTYD